MLALSILPPLALAAEFYRYTDADGQVHFVDDPRHIPEDRLNTLKVYQNAEPAADAAEGGLPEPEAAAVEGRAPAAPEVLETPVEVRGNRVLVPVEISHRGRKTQARLLFDTGASLTILHQQAARQAMLAGTETREAVVVGGDRIPIRMARVDAIRIGPYQVPNASVAIIRHEGPDPGHQGLLGMNILRHLDYTLDVNRGVIVWNR
jgi:predicted aspartyl protease